MSLLKNKNAWIVAFSASAIGVYLLWGWLGPATIGLRQWLLIIVMLIGGLPMIYNIGIDLVHGELGADALAAVSIITAFLLKEYLAGTIIVLMLSGGTLLESYAVHS